MWVEFCPQEGALSQARPLPARDWWSLSCIEHSKLSAWVASTLPGGPACLLASLRVAQVISTSHQKVYLRRACAAFTCD